jgi:hypothetical protein
MPSFGNSVEIVLKRASFRMIDLGGSQRRLESDYAGEVGGEAAGAHYGTLAVLVDVRDDPGTPSPFTYTGATLTTSGAIVSVSGSGISQLTAPGKVRMRGVDRFSTKDPKLAAFNNQIGAVEAELDAATGTLKATVLEWK